MSCEFYDTYSQEPIQKIFYIDSEIIICSVSKVFLLTETSNNEFYEMRNLIDTTNDLSFKGVIVKIMVKNKNIFILVKNESDTKNCILRLESNGNIKGKETSKSVSDFSVHSIDFDIVYISFENYIYQIELNERIGQIVKIGHNEDLEDFMLVLKTNSQIDNFWIHIDECDEKAIYIKEKKSFKKYLKDINQDNTIISFNSSTIKQIIPIFNENLIIW